MDINSFVLSAVLLLSAASLVVALFKHVGFGSMLGLLVAGIIVGPYTPGPYITSEVANLRQFTELGVIFLLFLIGLEMRPSRLWDMRREVFGLGTLQIVLTGAAIAFYVGLYQPFWESALLIGLTLSLSSTAFVMHLLQERSEIASLHGRTAFSVLLMQDLAIVPLLALVPILSDSGTLSASVPLWKQFGIVAVLLTILWVCGRYIIPLALERLSRQNNREGFFMVTMLAVFIGAWLMHQAGLSMALGAFIMGMFFSDSSYNLQIKAIVEPLKGILMSLFFVAVGMSIDLNAVFSQPWLFVQHTFVIVLIKIIVLFFLSLMFGFPRIPSARIALVLAQGGEFGFVLFSSGYALNIIDDNTFVFTISVISMSMLMTPFLVKFGDFLAAREVPVTQHDMTLDTVVKGKDKEDRVIIGGYGRVGHTVATILHSSGVQFIAFDLDPDNVKKGKADGMPVYFGDIGDADLLDAAGAGNSTLVILTIDHEPTAIKAVTLLRNNYQSLPIIVRVRDLKSAGHLIQAGATVALPEALESSLTLGAQSLSMIGFSQENVDSLIQGIRLKDYRLVRIDSEEST